MEALAQLSGYLLSNVLRAWAAGEPVNACIVLDGPSGREVQPYNEGDMMTAIKEAKSHLREKVLTSSRAVLLVPNAANGTESITLEAADFAEPGREVQLEVTRASKAGEPFRVGPVEVVRPANLTDAQKSAWRAALDRGVAENASGAAIWTQAR